MARTVQRRGPLGALALVLAVLIAGCGGEEKPQPLPAADAAFLLAQLDELDRRVQSRACNDVKRGNLVRIERRIDGLPENVDTEVRDALTDSVENLSGLVDTKCRPRRRSRPDPTPDPSPVVPDIPTTPSTTTPSTTTPEPTTTEEEEPPPVEDEGGDEDQSPPSGGGGSNGGGDSGNGNGGGNGNGASRGGTSNGGLPSGAITPPAGGGGPAAGAGPTP